MVPDCVSCSSGGEASGVGSAPRRGRELSPARAASRDCLHVSEPGCAVQAAIQAGALGAERFASWQKLQRELLAFAARHDYRVRLEQKRRLEGDRQGAARAAEEGTMRVLVDCRPTTARRPRGVGNRHDTPAHSTFLELGERTLALPDRRNPTASRSPSTMVRARSRRRRSWICSAPCCKGDVLRAGGPRPAPTGISPPTGGRGSRTGACIGVSIGRFRSCRGTSCAGKSCAAPRQSRKRRGLGRSTTGRRSAS